MSITLYDITKERRSALEDIADSGEITPDLEARLDHLNFTFESKLEACAHVLREKEAEAKAYREEAKRLSGMAVKVDKSVARLEAYVAFCLKSAGVVSIKAGLANWSFTHSVSMKALVDVDDLPPEFVRVKKEFDKQAAQQAYRLGQLPDCIEAVEGEHVRLT